MYRFICNECGHQFDEPYVYEERHGFDHGPFEKWSVCPNCCEPDYEEAFECEICGEVRPISQREIIKTDCCIIDACYSCIDKED